MATKQYITLENLSVFLSNLKNLFATKTELNSKAEESKTYTDNAIEQKSQVQIITWEADD